MARLMAASRGGRPSSGWTGLRELHDGREDTGQDGHGPYVLFNKIGLQALHLRATKVLGDELLLFFGTEDSTRGLASNLLIHARLARLVGHNNSWLSSGEQLTNLGFDFLELCVSYLGGCVKNYGLLDGE